MGARVMLTVCFQVSIFLERKCKTAKGYRLKRTVGHCVVPSLSFLPRIANGYQFLTIDHTRSRHVDLIRVHRNGEVQVLIWRRGESMKMLRSVSRHERDEVGRFAKEVWMRRRISVSSLLSAAEGTKRCTDSEGCRQKSHSIDVPAPEQRDCVLAPSDVSSTQ